MYLADNTLLQGGKYRIVRFINSGGFGCTYEAEHVMLEKRVAIKEFFIKDFCNRDGQTRHVTVGIESKRGLVQKMLRKFIDEARALCNMEHLGIVRVSDVFEENGTAYFVMKYIDGFSLNQVLKAQGPLPESVALRYILEVCDALAYVHAHNRLHLDIKPSNIMLGKNGHTVLIDFGASKQYDEVDGENTSSLVAKTPGYAPLEQMGNDVSKFMPATDIYALGATLYKLLKGVTPLSAIALASGEKLEPLPDTVSESTRTAIAAAMNQNKLLRPQSVEEFVALLKEDGTNHGKDEDEKTDLGKKTVVQKTSSDKPFSFSRKRFSYSILGLLGAVAVVVLFMMVKKGVELEKGEQKQAVIGTIVSDSVVSDPVVSEPAVEHKQEPENVEAERKDATFLLNVRFTNSNGQTFTYTGEVNNQKQPHGKGKGVYEYGTFTGFYENGIRKNGKYITKDQTNTFEGTFYNDKYNRGRLTMDDGSYYEGSFRNNNFFDGEWFFANGKREGWLRKGEFIDPGEMMR